MNSFSDEPIKLSESETELLTRALQEAQRQAETPTCAESETQFIRRVTGATNTKVGNARQAHHGSGNMIL